MTGHTLFFFKLFRFHRLTGKREFLFTVFLFYIFYH